MCRLQYPNPNKPFKLFTDTCKYSYLGIFHEEEVSDQPKAESNPVPIAYFSSLVKHNSCGTLPKRSVTQSISHSKIFILLSRQKCTLYCDHKLLASFFTTGMSSPVFDHCTLELQQFDIQFEQISGKKNVVADAISWLRTLGLYQDNGNDDIAATDDDVVKNVVEEVRGIELVPNSASYNMEKLNLDIL